MADINIEQLSECFSGYMVNALSKSELTIINQCNRAVEYEGSCASQLFTDAQALMNSAFETTVGRPLNRDTIKDFMAINTAWQLAKERAFYSSPTSNALS